MSQQSQSTPQAVYKAYSRANHTVARTRQVVMLYDGIIRFMKQARQHIEENDIENRFKKLVKSSDIVIGLQSCLDFDTGGESAKILYNYYSDIDMRIMELHRSGDIAECDSIIHDLKEMRDVWDHIDRDLPEKNAAPEVKTKQEMPQRPSEKSVTISA